MKRFIAENPHDSRRTFSKNYCGAWIRKSSTEQYRDTQAPNNKKTQMTKTGCPAQRIRSLPYGV
ncbi:hypothetical protein KA005_78940, partial [bacterium]|nr:hypothetical protein [bacterium]